MKNLFSNALKEKIIKHKEHQTGRSDLMRDRSRIAKPTGKRISAYGKIYYENRKNRSDLIGKKV